MVDVCHSNDVSFTLQQQHENNGRARLDGMFLGCIVFHFILNDALFYYCLCSVYISGGIGHLIDDMQRPSITFLSVHNDNDERHFYGPICGPCNGMTIEIDIGSVVVGQSGRWMKK